MNCRRLLAILTLVGLMSSPVAAAGKKIIGCIIPRQDEFFAAFQEGAEESAYGSGAKFLVAKSESNPDKEQSLIDTYISRGVNAIIVNPIDATASAPALDRAAKAGIKVITYLSTISGDAPSAFLNSSQEQIGQTIGAAAAKFIEDNLGGKAKIGVLQFKSLSPKQSAARVNGFLGAVKADGVDAVADQDAWLAEKAVVVAGDIITAHPDINILFAANEGGIVGAVQAVRNAGKQGKIFVFGAGGSEQLQSFLLDDDNVLQALTAEKAYRMGYNAVDAALAAIDGKPLDKVVIVPVQGLNRDNPPAIRNYAPLCKNLESVCELSP